MLRILLFISLLLSSLTLVESTSASVTYTPGATIAMTGSNSDVRFDVASALISNSSTESAPALDTTSLKFTGTFYGSGIGWIVFATGSNQVSLDCGIQPLSALSSNCSLIGIGWSENVGDIDFAGVTYSPTTGLISGSALTLAGDIDLTGIALPLRPVILNESTLVANHIATLSVSGAWMYDAGTIGWKGSVAVGLDTRLITSPNGTYTVDLSLANTYTVSIMDTNDSKTEISGFVVSPDILSTTMDTPHYADIYCGANPTDTINCPDGAPRSATTLTQLPAGSVIANGADTYTLTLKARDQYGNRVESGNIEIIYDTTVKNIQTDFTDNINYSAPICPDAIDIPTFTDACGEWNYSATLSPTDITYTIASTAPTDSNNEIKLNSITYNLGSDIALIGWKTGLGFDPLFTATVATVDAPIVNTPHTFETDMIQNGTTTITPTIITTMQIGDGSMAEWRSLSSNPAAECSNYPMTITMDSLCDWSGVSSIATLSSSDFAYTGTYTTWLSSTDTTTIGGYIYYNNGVSEILYRSTPSIATAATAATQRVRVLGQSGEGVSGGIRNRVDLINSIREQVALMDRNRTNYDDVEYLIIDGDYTINDMTIFDGATGVRAKRSIIALGGNITITNNILLRDSSVAIIALTGPTGNGGTIQIQGHVRDIHSSLIAEHAIISEQSDSQLYIHGSLVSANPAREIPPTGCPYFVGAGCVRSLYDLPGSRDAYAALTDKTGNSSMGGALYNSPLVIEGDPRIIRDPAPAMSR